MIVPVGQDAPARLIADRQGLLERLERAARRTRRRVEPEAIHDVRVATRRLEASLDLWRSILPRGRRRRARRALRALRRDLGPAREVRISLDLLRERFAALPPDARMAAAPLQDLLQEHLEPLEARAALRCGRRETGRLCHRVERVWEGIALVGEPGTSFLEAGRARLAKRRSGAQAVLREAAVSGANKRLHAARLAVKRWRYVLERLAATEPATDVSEQAWLRGMQGTLGRIQDLAELRGRALRLGPRLAPREIGVATEPMRSLLESFVAERAECVKKFHRLAATGAAGPAGLREAASTTLRRRGA